MGDRYYVRVACECGYRECDVYYAPISGYKTWECPKCHRIIDLEEYTSISEEECSNKDTMKSIIDIISKNNQQSNNK